MSRRTAARPPAAPAQMRKTAAQAAVKRSGLPKNATAGAGCGGTCAAPAAAATPAAAAASKRTRSPQLAHEAVSRHATKSISAPQCGQRSGVLTSSAEQGSVGQQMRVLGERPGEDGAAGEAADVRPVAHRPRIGGVHDDEQPTEQLEAHVQTEDRPRGDGHEMEPVSYTHLRAHET